MTTDTPKTRPRCACHISMVALRLVVERGHLGITNKLLQQASGRCSTAVGTVLAKLANRGALVVGRVTGHFNHWFANQELAQRWMSATLPQPKPAPTARQRVRPHQPRTAAQNPRVNRPHGAPVVLGQPRDSTDDHVVVPAGLKIQRPPAATHDPRYQCAPGERPFGAGFAAVGLGRDVTTGGAWGDRA